nr:50S ribosomal protein L24 [Anthocerotibacter panamensis]
MATSNAKPTFKVHVKTGDTVQVISGKYKGKVAKILKVIPEKSQVVVEGVNMVTKHVKAQGEQPGRKDRKEGPIHSSKVMLYSEKQKTASRAGIRITEDGRKVRYLKKTDEVLDAKPKK